VPINLAGANPLIDADEVSRVVDAFVADLALFASQRRRRSLDAVARTLTDALTHGDEGNWRLAYAAVAQTFSSDDGSIIDGRAAAALARVRLFLMENRDLAEAVRDA
jgi:hypothetical protein